MDIRYVIACDFGQANDYSTAAVIERRIVPVGKKYNYEGMRWEGDLHHGGYCEFTEVRQDVEAYYDLLRLERVPLYTSYTKVGRGIIKLVTEFYRAHKAREDYRGGDLEIGLAVDEGGVGVALKDIILEAIADHLDEEIQPHLRFFPVACHSGFNTTYENGFWHPPKRDLIAAGHICYQQQRLKVRKLRYRDVLEEELRNYRLKQSPLSGQLSYGPWREGAHDDLLFATCLGCWVWERAIEKREHISFPGEVLAEGPTLFIS